MNIKQKLFFVVKDSQVLNTEFYIIGTNTILATKISWEDYRSTVYTKV